MRSRAAVRAFGVGVLVAAVSAAVVSGAVAEPSGPGPGNSPNAKLCQQGGWENLVTSTGESFTNEGTCTSYAARGGTLVERMAYDKQQWRTTCQNAGGAFVGPGVGQWQCEFPSPVASQATYDALQTTCTDAGGRTFANPSYAPYRSIVCDLY